MAELTPPKVQPEDSGTADLESSSDDQFSDAPEGTQQASRSPPIPTTRVERVDDEPRHGETPGTAAFEKRKADAEPDEFEVVAEDSTIGAPSPSATIPATVVDKVDPDTPSHGEVPNTAAHALRRAAAEPDVVRQAPDVATNQRLQDSGSQDDDHGDYDEQVDGDDGDNDNERDDDANDRGSRVEEAAEDDFDDFADGDDGDDDFGAFDEAEDGDGGDLDAAAPAHAQTVDAERRSRLPAVDFAGLDGPDDVADACREHLTVIFPTSNTTSADTVPPEVNVAFLTERSQSLWAQLVAPPPLQPPDWVRSRIRRVFLVSLGVPVDLDEILPASKQKKLVLPSVDNESGRRSLDGGSLARLKQSGKNASSSSVGSAPARSERRRRGPPPPPDFDGNAARLLCSTTDIALAGLTDRRLSQRVAQLEQLKQAAMQTLEFWLIQKDSAAGDKEAFEEVIENLVKHAKKVRR